MYQFAQIFQVIWTILQAFSVVQSVVETVSPVISGAYDFMVDTGLLEPQKNVKNYLDKLKGACKLSAFLKKSLTMIKEANEDQTQKVEAALVSLEYLDLILKVLSQGSDLDFRQKLHEVQKVEEIYSDLKMALNCIKLRVKLNKSRSVKQMFLKHKWITAKHTEQQLKEIEDKIKNAVQKSIELMTISTLVALNRVQVLQHFNTYRTWLVTDDTADPPSPPQLHVAEFRNKFVLTWSKRSNNKDVTCFELCYDEDQNLSMPLNGSRHKIEIGSPQVIPGRIYSMKIRGVNEGGAGNWSNLVVAQFTKPFPLKPDPPEIDVVNTSRVRLSVVPSQASCETESAVTEWNVQYMVDGQDKEWTLVNYKAKCYKNKQILDVINLIPYQKYYFRIQAINADGKSDFSQPVCARTEFKPSLNAPEIDIINPSKVKLTMRSPNLSTPVTKWKLQCTHELPESITYEAESDDNHDIQIFVLKDILPNQYYNIQVEAVFTDGCSVISPAVSFKTAHVSPPSIAYVNPPSFVTLLLQLALALSTMLTPIFLYYAISLFLYHQEYIIPSWYYINAYEIPRVHIIK